MPTSTKDRLITCGVIALLMSALSMVFFYAPVEVTQGVVQKIFYLHLSFVVCMYVPLFFGMLYAIIYLVTKHAWSDQLSNAFVEIGYLFTTGVLLSGSIWAKPVWGAWWTWDARLTTTLLIWLVYTSYLLVRFYFGRDESGKIWSATLAILGFLDVPLIHYSVTLFRGVHPKVITEGGMAPAMSQTLLMCIAAFCALAAWMIVLRYRLGMLQFKLQTLESR